MGVHVLDKRVVARFGGNWHDLRLDGIAGREPYFDLLWYEGAW